MAPKKADASLSDEKIFEYGWQMFDHLSGQIQYADTKASLILGADAILIGALAAMLPKSGQAFLASARHWNEFLSMGLLGLAFLSLFVSIYFALLVARPAMGSPKKAGLFYFKMIQNLETDSFIERFEGLTPTQVRRDLLTQVHTLARITENKFLRNAYSLNFLLATLFLWGLSQIIVMFP